MKHTLNSDYLDTIWRKWNIENGSPRFYHSYNRVTRAYTGKKFEDWLFDKGGIIKQHSRKRYIEFMTGEQATWFILKYL
jgi:hypothetical protein